MLKYGALVVAFCLGVILIVTGNRECGVIANTVVDKRAAVLAHDTVPAIQQDGDTLKARTVCVQNTGNSIPLTAFGFALVGIAGVVSVKLARAGPPVERV